MIRVPDRHGGRGGWAVTVVIVRLVIIRSLGFKLCVLGLVCWNWCAGIGSEIVLGTREVQEEEGEAD
jgi:hypothetical protein